MPRSNINEALSRQTQSLMTIPGVAGVYVGLVPDDKTPCLKMIVVNHIEEIGKKIPRSLEGYPALIEESGPIRPLAGK